MTRDPTGYPEPDDAWGTPGYEFESRRSRPPQPARPPQPTQPRPPEPHRPSEPHRPRDPRREPAPPRPSRFRYTSTVSEPPWPRDDDEPDPIPGFEFDNRARHVTPTTTDPFTPLFAEVPRDEGPGTSATATRDWLGSPWVSPQGPPLHEPLSDDPPRPAPSRHNRSRPDPPHHEPHASTAGVEWTQLLGSLIPAPAKRNWSREVLAELSFRGWVNRVAIPIVAMIVLGVAIVVFTGANSGNVAQAPPSASLGFPPATLAGGEFTVAPNDRGITQTLDRVATDGPEIVAVGSQAGARIARAQFFVSPNDGHSWTMATVRTPSGGAPPPGHAARFIAGGQGKWVAVGPGSIWTSTDGRTWTLTPNAGMPLRPGDQLSALRRTASGFIAVGANVPGGDQAKSTPVIFLSADGVSWQRLGAAQLGLPAGTGRVLNIRSAAVVGQSILIAGDVKTTTVATSHSTITINGAKHTVTSSRTMTTVAGGAWLSRDGGSSWATALPPGVAPAGHGAQPQITGVAAAGDGFVLVRPATASGHPAVDTYRSANGTAWTFETTLTAAAGLTSDMVNGGPDGAVITGQSGQSLTAFVSANGVAWQPAGSFGSAKSESVSGAAMTQAGAVVTGTVAGAQSRQLGSQPGRQPAMTLLSGHAQPVQVNVVKIPGAFDPQLAVNSVAAVDGTQIAVGSANGFPAIWSSADGGSSWTPGEGATPAVLTRPGLQQLTSVTYGTAGWLAVGGVTAGASQHPVVVSSTDGSSWQAADGEGAFGAHGLVTEQAAAGPGGYVIVGYQESPQSSGPQSSGGRSSGGRSGSTHTVAAAWWSAGLIGWQRAGDAVPGALDGAGVSKQMLAVAASSKGFVAVGSAGDQAAAWTSATGQTWRQADVPAPLGSTRTELQHVASNGRTTVATGTAVTSSGQQLPFAARSTDGGLTWTESALPVPAGQASVTAIAAAGGAFTVAGTFGATPGHQDVVLWTSPDGTTWRAVTPSGQGLTGPGIQAITALTASGSTLTGVGYTATPTTEQPVFWQSPIR